jgi:hypothetical protein
MPRYHRVGQLVKSVQIGFNGRNLTAHLYATQREGGRRIKVAEVIEGEQFPKQVFDTDDCYDNANAVDALEQWVTSQITGTNTI